MCLCYYRHLYLNITHTHICIYIHIYMMMRPCEAKSPRKPSNIYDRKIVPLKIIDLESNK